MNVIFEAKMNNLKVLVAVDFDHTLVNCNSDLRVKSLAPDGNIPEDIEQLSDNPNGWTPYMKELFRYLHKNNVKQSDYASCLSGIELVEGMKELLLMMHQSSECEIIIISDSNSVFIQHVLQHNGLDEAVCAVYTNPASFDDDGCLNIKEYQFQDWCKKCAKNICKGWVLESHIKRREEEGISFFRIVYIGDGRNDVCPALKLTDNDFVFARKGFRLLKRLEKMPARDVKAAVCSWESGHDIKSMLLSSRN